MKVKCQHSNFDIDLRVFLGWRNPRKYLVTSIPVCQDKITFQNCSENQNVHQLLSFYPTEEVYQRSIVLMIKTTIFQCYDV